MNANKKAIKAADTPKGSVLGTFTGKCCDFNVMNNNDMHLSRELFENLMQSDEYKRAMKLGHYIGFLSHPEDPDCQDDKNACIVMRDMRLLDNGDIEGDFDLINTPVGQIVKTFTDAGVKYGLSIRGLGDVDGNGEVDPEGFIFRGFDLVRFPAYDDCIPEFKAIAASTDAKKKAAYKKICASIDANLDKITSSEALSFIRDELVDGSDEFNKVQDRINQLATECDGSCKEGELECALDVQTQKLAAMTDLYLEAVEKIKDLEGQLVESYAEKDELVIQCSSAKHKYAHLRKITANQIEDARQTCEDLTRKNETLKQDYEASRTSLRRIKASLNVSRNELETAKQALADEQASHKNDIRANSILKRRVKALLANKADDKHTIEASNDLNLKYQRKIEASSEAISQKDSAIEELKTKLHETVVANKKLESKASNLDEKNGELLSRVEAAEEMVLSYQQAYANIYANALGVYISELPITANTSVDDLKQMIKAGTSTSGIAANPDVYIEGDEDEFEEDFSSEEYTDDEILDDDVNYGADMVTL